MTDDRADNTADYIILKTTQYMEENYFSKITVDDLSRIVNMSTPNFFRYFKKVFNTSPIQKNKDIARDGYACVHRQIDIVHSSGMRLFRRVAFYSRVRTIDEHEAERIPPESSGRLEPQLNV